MSSVEASYHIFLADVNIFLKNPVDKMSFSAPERKRAHINKAGDYVKVREAITNETA